MKRNLRSLFCLLIVIALLAGCTPASSPDSTEPTTEPITEPVTEPTEDPAIAMAELEDRLASYAQLGSSPDDHYRTWYEIFVYSFCDSNGDGIGDLNGVISKLDYLESLGINGIWLMPINPSNSYHKYDVYDYFDIDPQYGTMYDFENLLAECEARGIKVIMDLVINHSSNQHEWFAITAEYLRDLPEGEEPSAEDCEYFDYYNWSKEKLAGYSKLGGTDYYYECQFSNGMPDLNLGNETLRAELTKVMRYWLEMGVAGFRVDAAKEFYTGNVEKTTEVMNWLYSTAASLDADVYMVGEAWSDFSTIASYYKSGFLSFFNFPFADSGGKIITTVRNIGNPNMIPSYAKALQAAHEAYSESNPNYIDAPFLSNHDMGRIFGFASGEEYKIKLAGAMNVLMSGSCFIYYGEEIAMPGSGNDPSKRAPMFWNQLRTDGTTNPPPSCTIPAEYPYGSLEDQINDAGSIYNFYREVIAIRNALPVISHGVTTAEEALNVNCISAQRKTWNDQECIILMNINTEAAQVDLSAYADWKLAATLSVDGNPTELDGTTLNMAACGIAILLPN
jgi:glycosidase